MTKEKYYGYKEIADCLEANGQQEAADRLRAEFASKEKRKKIVDHFKDRWESLNETLRFGLTLLSFAGTIVFFLCLYYYGIVETLSNFVRAILALALISGFFFTIGGLVIEAEKSKEQQQKDE